MRNPYDFFNLSFSFHTGSPSRMARDQQHGDGGASGENDPRLLIARHSRRKACKPGNLRLRFESW